MKITKNEAGYYEVRYKTPDGKVRTKSTRKKQIKDARELIDNAKIAELELAAEMGILTPAVVSVLVGGKKRTVEEAIEPWLEWRRGKHHSGHSLHDARIWVMAWARDGGLLETPLMKITEMHINSWVNSTASNNKLGTRRVMLSYLRSFFSFCSAKGWVLGDPSALVSVDLAQLLHEQKEIRKQPVFTDDEVAHLLYLTAEDGPKPSIFWHAAIAIARHTGLRLGDIAMLEWSCLSVAGKICVWTQKRDRRVELPLDPEALRQAILQLPKQDPVYLFPRQKAIIRDPTQRSTLSAEFVILCQLCGIVGKTFHALRATYCSECHAKGIPMHHIADRVGHSNIATTKGYIR